MGYYVCAIKIKTQYIAIPKHMDKIQYTKKEVQLIKVIMFIVITAMIITVAL